MNCVQLLFGALCLNFALTFEVKSQIVQPSFELQQEKEIASEELSPIIEKVTPSPLFHLPPQELNLVDAVLQNNFVLVEQLLKQGTPINQTNELGETPLCAALQEGFHPLAVYLVLRGADPNLAGSEAQPPIIYAALRRHLVLMDTLLEAGADPNVHVSFPPSPKFLSAVQDSGLERQLKLHRNMTPLMLASYRGDVEAVSHLLNHKAKVHAMTKPYSRYAINFAAQKNYLYIMRLLLGRKPEEEPRLLITINLTTQKAKLEIDGETRLETKVSTGRKGFETPPGRYVITNRHKSWTSTIYHVKMPYFMRLNCSAIGLHSGYVTGRPASHGCIRLPSNMASKFFALATVGDEVNIER